MLVGSGGDGLGEATRGPRAARAAANAASNFVETYVYGQTVSEEKTIDPGVGFGTGASRDSVSNSQPPTGSHQNPQKAGDFPPFLSKHPSEWKRSLRKERLGVAADPEFRESVWRFAALAVVEEVGTTRTRDLGGSLDSKKSLPALSGNGQGTDGGQTDFGAVTSTTAAATSTTTSTATTSTTAPPLALDLANPASLDDLLRGDPNATRFFVIKSYTEDDVHKSIKYGCWTSTNSGNRKLDAAFCGMAYPPADEGGVSSTDDDLFAEVTRRAERAMERRLGTGTGDGDERDDETPGGVDGNEKEKEETLTSAFHEKDFAKTTPGEVTDDATPKVSPETSPCRVLLLFSVNSSGHFCGVAEMISKVDFEVRDGPSPNPVTGRLPVVRP